MKKNERLEYLFKSLSMMAEEDLLSGNEEAYVTMVEDLYKRRGKIDYVQDSVLEDIYRRASER